VRHWATSTFSGRAVVGGFVAKIVAFALGLIAGPARWIELIDTFGDLSIIVGALIVMVLVSADVKQRLLWRVRRKLTVSYIFIGFIPALLIVCFFLVVGLGLFYNVSSYLMKEQLARIVDQAGFVAQSAADGIERARDADRVRNVLEARVATLAPTFPDASIAIASAARTCGTRSLDLPPLQPLVAGTWGHTAPPLQIPRWISCQGYAGVTTYRKGAQEFATVRAARWLPGTNQLVIVDIPFDAAVARTVRARLGAAVEGVAVATTPVDVSGPRDDNEDWSPVTTNWTDADTRGPGASGNTWFALFAFNDWDAGAQKTLVISFQMRLRQIYNEIAIGLESGLEDVTVILAVLGGLFLVIQGVAFAMGLALARSITGSVHELAEGTERVRRGDFAGRIPIKSRDQLGELSESFNSMTSSIEDLLQQKAEKERLAQELRIARSIQMSLLPQGPLSMPGISLVAHCEPAREVGGDYYDFLPIDESTLGILVADVSGKGTSAALYMAELKGIVLTLSQRHRSPRDLLIEADRIISKHLDSRSFITVTYLVVDLRAGTLKYARAGHCPMVYVPGPYAERRSPQLMTPDGMVLGLQLDEGRTFNRLLEEVTVPLGRGDLFVLYTDGMTEAMNSDGDCFGDTRLADLIAQHADLAADQLRERVLREIDAFTGSADQQDDMTMVLLRVEQVGPTVGAPALAHADA
jgi:serine phosphatase RsbU (regulator of sigma subunit)